jgi:hypothetical protein
LGRLKLSLHHLKLFRKYPAQEFYCLKFNEVTVMSVDPLKQLSDILAALPIAALTIGFA